MSDPVLAQYEALPYPPRDPRDETKRLITGSPSRLVELNHFVFGGRRDFGKPFRALVAGGGTGDAAIMLGQQLADAGAAKAEIVYLDWSQPSRAVAEERARVRGLTNIRFVTGSLLDYATLELGRFDYIDCCGVLHHLPDPPATLAALAASLADDGGMGMMLYGRLGRTGVYPLQEALRAIIRDGDAIAARVDLAKKLLEQLPPTNWLRKNPQLTDHIAEGDSGLFDLLLHERDRAYDVREIDALVAGAGLRLTGFVPPARYEPATYINNPTLRGRLDGKTTIERAAFAESIAGDIKVHIFYAVRAANAVPLPRPDDARAVPVFCAPETAATARAHRPGSTLTGGVDQWKVKLPLPDLCQAIAEQNDGRRSLGEIHAALRQRRPDLTWDGFARQFGQYYTAFHGLGLLLLRVPG